MKVPFMSKKDFFGIVVYTINEDGCFTGLWTNRELDGEVMNEIAKQKEKSEHNELCGQYTLSYIENGKSISGEMDISYNSTDECYEMIQTIKGEGTFEGKGFKFNNKLVFSYWKS